MLTFDQLTDYNNILDAHRKTCRGRFKYTKQALKFNYEKDKNLIILQSQLINGTFKFDPYQYMVITDKKKRVVHAPSFKDKIIHHIVNNKLLPYVTTRFIKNSFSCIEYRGNLNAVKQLQKNMRITKRLYGENARYIKIDISKFFYTINRNVLKERLTYVIKDNNILNLMYKLIDSHNTTNIGLPLGNLTSQMLANIYLDYIDKYVIRTLGLKYYLRYADDIFIFIPNKYIGKLVKDKVINLLNTKLKLVVNPNKCYINKIDRIHALGYNIYLDKIKVDNRSKNTMKQYIKKMSARSLNGWYSQASLAKCHSLIYKNIENTILNFDGKVFSYK